MNSTQIELLHQAHESLRSARLLLNQGRYALAAPRAREVAFLVVEALLAGQGLEEFPGRPELAAAFDEHWAGTGLTPPALHEYLAQAAQPEAVQIVLRDQAATEVEHAEQFLDLARRLIGPFSDDDSE
jgi:uncharacterized protein (UPF0332 family)